MKSILQFLRNAWMPAVVFLGVVAIWQIVVIAFKIHPIVLPSPIAVLQSGWERREVLFRGAWITSLAALVGFVTSVLVGTLIAILFSQSARIRTALYPYVIFLQTVPIVAIAPLLIIWSGYNFRTIVLVTVIISVFPIIANVTAGLISIDKNLRDLFTLYSASRWQTLVKLRIPAAIPHLVIGMRISCGLAVVGAIIGELFVGSGGTYEGLGTIMTKWQARNLTSALIAAVLVSTIIGVAFFVGVNLFSRTALRRWTVGTNFESEP